MNNSLLQRPLFSLTVQEFLTLKANEPQQINTTIVEDKTPKFLYSLKELAEFIGCGIVTAQKIKNSGRIRYRQIGRKLIFNTTEILEDLNKKGGRK